MALTTVLLHAALFIAEWALHRACKRSSPYVFAAILIPSTVVIAACGGVLLAFLAGENLFGTVRLWCWALFAHGPLLLGMILVHARRRREGSGHRALQSTCAVGIVALIAVAFDAFLIEPTSLEISRVEVRSNKLSRPARIALVADIQSDKIGEFEREVMRAVMAAEPDAIFFAGDYIQLDDESAPEQQAALAKLFRELELAAPLGVFAVRGNTDAKGWQRVFEGVEAHLFTEMESLHVGEWIVTGLPPRDSHDSRLKIKATDSFQIALGHHPDYARGPADADLLLAGHCHGGQVRIPFLGPPLTLSSIPRKWTSGAHEIRPGTTLIVSRGIGMERASAPRLRFLCRPELVLIDLVPER